MVSVHAVELQQSYSKRSTHPEISVYSYYKYTVVIPLLALLLLLATNSRCIFAK